MDAGNTKANTIVPLSLNFSGAVVLILGHPSDHLESLLKHRLLGPTLRVSDWFQHYWCRLQNFDFQQIPKCCWCCWSWDRTLRITLLEEGIAVYPPGFQSAYLLLTHAHCRTPFEAIYSSKHAFCKYNLVCMDSA